MKHTERKSSALLPYPPLQSRENASKRFESIVFHPERCTGCGLCQSACGGRKSMFSMPDRACIQPTPVPEHGGSYTIFCQHCREPHCLAACPQGAISRNKEGIVAIDKQLCVNCGLCQSACTMAAPLRTGAGEIAKCDLCAGKPACVDACPQQALVYTRGKKFRLLGSLRWPVQIISFLLLVIVLVGSVCSLSIAAFDLACPTGVLQNIFSSKVLLVSAIVSALIILIPAMFFGRFFCGWMCPFGFILDLADKILPQKGSLPAWLANRRNKYGVLAGAAGASAIVGTQAFCIVCPIGSVCRSYGLQSTLAGAELAVVPLLISMDIGAKRSWCRYFCPVGALLALFSKIGLIQIEIGSAACKKFSCKRCAEVCPVGIISGRKLQSGLGHFVNTAECIMCLRCVDICPYKSAKLRFGWPHRKTKRAEGVIVPEEKPAFSTNYDELKQNSR